MDAAARAPDVDVQRFEVLIIGAGISGLYQLHRLRELGLSVRVLEHGSGVGGTWYWNRYPGARFDSESWSYGFAFSEELLQEWNWREHFSAQPDTLAYVEYAADKFDWRRDIDFNAHVVSARWIEERREWHVETADGRRYAANLMITALGPLSAPVMPVIDGMEEFEGLSFHTARWPHEPVDLKGKRVGIIGTGATAIQVIQTIASEVGHLTVFQRNPNWAAPIKNGVITPEEQADIKARYKEIYQRCRETLTCFIHNPDPRKAVETPAEEREAFWEELYDSPGFGIWMGNFSDVLTDKEANRLMTEFATRKIRERVHDPVIADKLTPKNHGFGTRRLPLENGYYEVYNRDNVRLVDVNEMPIERVTANGVQTSAEEHEFDILIYATGFDGVTGPYDRIEIIGPDGRSLREDWREGLPRTYLGVQAEGFPNMIMVLGPHTARGNIPRNSEQIIDFTTAMVKHVKENGITRIEPNPEAVERWGEAVEEAARGLLSSQIKSWQTGVNRNVPGRDVLRVLGYNGSAVKYRKLTEREAADGLPNFLLD